MVRRFISVTPDSREHAGRRERRKNRRAGAFLFLTVGMVALVLVALPATSFGRAGGGEGYSGGGGEGGGGGFGGGGHGGGGGGGFILYLLLRLLFDYPVIGVPLLIIVIYLMYVGGQRGNYSYQGNVIRRGGNLIDQQQKGNALAMLRQHDPQFDEQAFCQRVAAAFFKIQEAWTAQDLTRVRAFISDGVHERFSLQFAEQRDEGYRDVLQGLSIDDVRVADVSSAGVFDEISVRIAARAADFRVGLTDGRALGGSTIVEPFVEVWSFLRKRGALTDMSKPGLIEGNCPNCGAPIEMNQSANCLRCKAILRSGQYDWVLGEITQESEWEPSSFRTIHGLAAISRQDPGFDALAMEDRASVIFWRKAAADRTGKIDPLRKVASESLCQSYAARIAPASDGTRTFIGQCAVGSVRMIGFLPGDEGSGFERVILEIRWSGRRASAPVVARTLFVVGRKTGSQTDADKSISSAHCPNCGAPMANDTSNACDYCRTTLNDGAHGWTLVELAAVTSPRGQELLSSLSAEVEDRDAINGVAAAAPLGESGLLAWAVKVAAADGNVDESERQVLAGYALRRGVPPERLEQMIGAAIANNLDVPAPRDRNETQTWLAAMAAVACADGNCSDEEFALLRTLGRTISLTDEEVRLLVKRARADRYAATSAALRGINNRN